MRVILSLMLIVLFTPACKHSIDCSKVRNGKFFYYTKLYREKIPIERIDSVQLETDPKTNKIVRSKIEWKNDCSFYLFVSAFNDSPLSYEDSIIASKPATIEILEVNADFYTCLVKFSTSKQEYQIKDTMYFQK